MEILTPIPQEPHQENPQNLGIPQDFQDAGINFKNAEFLNHLGLKNELFNPQIMEKVDFIASKIENLESLQDIDMRLGHDNSMPRIDKIFSYLKLIEQSEIMKEKQELIDKQIQHYEFS